MQMNGMEKGLYFIGTGYILTTLGVVFPALTVYILLPAGGWGGGWWGIGSVLHGPDCHDLMKCRLPVAALALIQLNLNALRSAFHNQWARLTQHGLLFISLVH